MVKELHHVSIIVSSEASICFYASLGFKEIRRIERKYDTVVLMEGPFVLEAYIDPSHPTQNNSLPLGIRNMSLIVEHIDEMALEQGLEISKDWNGEKYIVLKDPDGNIVQLHE